MRFSISADTLALFEIGCGKAAVIDQHSPVQGLCFGQGQEVHGLDNGTGVLGTFHFAAGQEMIDKFRAVIAALALVGNPEGCQIQSQIIVVVRGCLG